VRRTRNTPAEIARALRQEACFGCVLCGNPFVEYHHIKPYGEEHHFDPARMVAVCPTCHDRFHRMTPEKQYRTKANPINRARGVVKGELEFKIPLNAMALGTNLFLNCPNLLGFDGKPHLSWKVSDGEWKFTMRVIGKDGSPLLEIVDNEFSFFPTHFWDVVTKYNFFMMKSKGGAHKISVDLRQVPATVSFVSFLAGHKLQIRPNKSVRLDPKNCHIDHGTFQNSDAFCLHVSSPEFDPNKIPDLYLINMS
jgi:HNH endonuclease